MKEFLKRIDDTLHEMGHKRPWLADQAGISVGTINNWFAYDRYPAVDAAHKVARALGVSLDFLMTGVHPAREIEDPTVREIIEYLEGLTPAQLAETWGMIKLAKAINLTDHPRESRNAG